MTVSWESVLSDIEQCEGCDLCKTRPHGVPGAGTEHAALMCVGEGPREDVYIANVVKCRPPQNRTPLPEEMHACLPHLRGQFALVRPKIIVCLGATAARALINPEIRITRERGQWTEKKGVFFLPTYHPAARRRDPAKKREAWEDLQKVMKKLEELHDETGNA